MRAAEKPGWRNREMISIIKMENVALRNEMYSLNADLWIIVCVFTMWKGVSWKHDQPPIGRWPKRRDREIHDAHATTNHRSKRVSVWLGWAAGLRLMGAISDRAYRQNKYTYEPPRTVISHLLLVGVNVCVHVRVQLCSHHMYMFYE